MEPPGIPGRFKLTLGNVTVEGGGEIGMLTVGQGISMGGHALLRISGRVPQLELGDVALRNNFGAVSFLFDKELLRIDKATGDVTITGNLRVNGKLIADNSNGPHNAAAYASIASHILRLQQDRREERLENLARTTVIAQEVEAVLPDAVTSDRAGYKSVRYAYLIPLLIEAVKAQDRTIREQSDTLARQQADLDVLPLAYRASQQQSVNDPTTSDR